MRLLFFVGATALMALSLACGGGGEGDVQADPTPGGVGTPDTGTSGTGISIEAALSSGLTGPLLVNGFVLASSGDVRLCDALAESFPPQCGGQSLAVERLDLSTVPGVRSSGGVTWSDLSMQIRGTLSGGALTSEAIQSKSPSADRPLASSTPDGGTDARTPDREGKMVTHVVEPGDSLSGIADRYASTVEAIRDANGRDEGDIVIRIGEELQVPAGVRPPLLDSVRATITTDNLNVRLGPSLDHMVLGKLNSGAEVEVTGRTVGSGWLALGGLGWVFFDPSWIEIEEDLGLIRLLNPRDPSTTGPTHPADLRTGVAAVDEAINVVLSRDPARVQALIRLQSLGCTTRLGLGGPPACPEGVAEGTLVELLPISNCEGGGVLREHVGWAVERWLATAPGGEPAQALGTYAVVRAQGQSTTIFGGAAYGVVFSDEGGAGRLAWVAGDGGITGLTTGCGPTSPGRMMRSGGAPPDFLLGPAVPNQLEPVN